MPRPHLLAPALAGALIAAVVPVSALALGAAPAAAPVPGAQAVADPGVTALGRLQAAATMGAAEAAPGAALGNAPLDQTFELSSKPGAARTIYLDFRGGTVTQSNWNFYYSNNAPIPYEPFSIDDDVSTDFSDAELVEIQKAWQVVAEDYAPFDVNVTTQYPGEAAITRLDNADPAYGTRAVITNGGIVYDRCRCGGIAYVNAWKYAGGAHDGTQPAWVFSEGASTNGKYLGEAASHEVGHQFGLNHDGQRTGGEYYRGSDPWAPIMGTSYYQPITQWSKASYPEANNPQDDVALIAAGAPYRTDEDKGGAIALANGQSRNGIVARANDVDTYTVKAAGTVTVTVDSGSPFPDLDVLLKVTQGFTTVATANPPAVRVTPSEASGLGASVTFTTPAAGATYKVTVQGTGQGNPAQPGGYSSYGSIGTYRISVAVTPPVPPTPVVVAAQNASGQVGVALSEQLVATGGSGTFTWAKVAGTLPGGVTLGKTGVLAGKPTKAGTYTFTAKATSGTVSGTGQVTVTVAPAPPPLAWVTKAALPAGKVGVPYSATISVTGGTPPYASISRSAGAVPYGLWLTGTGASVTLVGTPAKAGYSSFTLRAIDDKGTSITRTFTVRVVK